MGVPAFFRWLTKKYPGIVSHKEGGSQAERTCDNLYVDMNDIVHYCTHPEDRPPPQTEDERFEAIQDYIEMIMKMVRPQKLLYMAIDGVAPRAKMNQQRKRRFRAAKERQEKADKIKGILEKMKNNDIDVHSFSSKNSFDHKVITPGTTFMVNLSASLRKWIDEKLSPDYEDPDGLWPKDLVVILSDASVPGEGEHKIMDYLRKQKVQPTYNCNLSHCLLGADADLIMLGLATHELNFTILRKEFVPNQPGPCDICSQFGHTMHECEGDPRDPDEPDIAPTPPGFIYIKLSILREYLEKESDGLNLERFIDDFVFLCFLVGNDFLPHLPSLEIREGAIDRLLNIYRHVMRQGSRDYLTSNGIVNLKQVQKILTVLGQCEDNIFKMRKESDDRFKERNERHKNQNQQDCDVLEQEDNIRLGIGGWKNRYYLHKFACCYSTDISQQVAREYVIGLCWILLYYYQGCPDWQWFYPYHYAPFASDFRNIDRVEVQFNRDSKPFKPFEQLMSISPAELSQDLPESWKKLMSEPTSPIIDFYPTQFDIDLKGKGAPWMGVALLPFIDEERLFKALQKVYDDLTEEEKYRNSHGPHLLFVSRANKLASVFLKEVISSGESSERKIDPRHFYNISAMVRPSERFTKTYKHTYCVEYRDSLSHFISPTVRNAEVNRNEFQRKEPSLSFAVMDRWEGEDEDDDEVEVKVEAKTPSLKKKKVFVRKIAEKEAKEAQRGHLISENSSGANPLVSEKDMDEFRKIFVNGSKWFEKSPLYVSFLESAFRDLCTPLKAEDIKRIASNLTRLSNEKLFASKATKKKKKPTATLKMERSDVVDFGDVDKDERDESMFTFYLNLMASQRTDEPQIEKRKKAKKKHKYIHF